MKTFKGFYTDLSNQDYHDDTSHYSSSVLKKALKGAQYFYDYVVTKTKQEDMPTDALDLGSYLHTALLEPELLESTTEVYPMRTRGKGFDAFKTEHFGKTVITMAELETAEEIINRMNTDFIDVGETEDIPCKELFKGGKSEESLFTRLDDTPIKVRFDYAIYRKDHILIRDFKTCGGTANSESEADYICKRLGYYISAALYIDALRTALPGLGYPEDTPIYFELVFASKKDYNINIYRLSEETLEHGRQQYKKAIELIKLWKRVGYKSGLRKL